MLSFWANIWWWNPIKITILGYITVWTVVQAVLTATFNSYGNRQISTPYKISTPAPIEKKFGTVDYVREGTPYTKFGIDPPTEGFWANGWNITEIIFIYTFFGGTRTGRTDGWILRVIAQKTWNNARMCLFEVIKVKFNFKPLFLSPKTVKFWPKTGCSRVNYP